MQLYDDELRDLISDVRRVRRKQTSNIGANVAIVVYHLLSIGMKQSGCGFSPKYDFTAVLKAINQYKESPEWTSDSTMDEVNCHRLVGIVDRLRAGGHATHGTPVLLLYICKYMIAHGITNPILLNDIHLDRISNAVDKHYMDRSHRKVAEELFETSTSVDSEFGSALGKVNMNELQQSIDKVSEEELVNSLAAALMEYERKDGGDYTLYGSEEGAMDKIVGYFVAKLLGN